jgi:hypothetical protein
VRYKSREKLFIDAHFGARVDEACAPVNQLLVHIHCTVNNNILLNNARFSFPARHETRSTSGAMRVVELQTSRPGDADSVAASIINYKSPAVLQNAYSLQNSITFRHF